MAQVGLNLFFTGYTGNLIVVWKKATAPLAEVDRSDALPFPVNQVINAPNLSPEVYNFEFWQSSDGVSLDTKIRPDWPIDASAYNGGIATSYEYVVDRGNTGGTIGNGDYWIDPESNQTEIIDERYKGVAKEHIHVSMRGIGKRRSDEWDVRAEGGINLTAVDPGSGDPEVFAPFDSIFVDVFQKTSTPSAPTGSGSEYSDVLEVNADAPVNSTFKNKIIFCNSSNPVTVLTFPAFNTMADQKIKFVTAGMTGNYLSLVFTSAIVFQGNRDKIHLSTGRVFELMIKSGVAYAISPISDAGYDVRGNRVFVDAVKDHQRLCDDIIYNPAEYPGIVEWINEQNPAIKVSTFASWNTDANRRKFYLNEVGGELAFGDLRNMHTRSLETFDGTNGYPGLFNNDAMPLHYHEQTIGVLPTVVFGRGTVSRKKGNYDKQQDGVTDITGPPCNTDGSAITTSNEVKVKSFRQYVAINL